MSDFQLDQVLGLQDSRHPRQMRFMHLPESADLLLCVLNIIYIYFLFISWARFYFCKYSIPFLFSVLCLVDSILG